MKDSSPDKRDYMLRKVSYLFSLGLPNSDIANLLSRDPAQITTDVREAQERGYLRITKEYVQRPGLSPISPEEIFNEHMIARELINKLILWENEGIPGSKEAFVRPRVIVLSSHEDLDVDREDVCEPFQDDWTVNREYAGWDSVPHRSDKATCHFTSLILEEILLSLQSCKTVGVCWGRTLNALLEKAPQKCPNLAARYIKNKHVVVIPLWGEAWRFYRVRTKSKRFPNREALSSTYLARCLSRLLNGNEDHARSLRAAPALIPPELLEHAEIIKRFLATQSAFDEIFRSGGAADNLDAILATVGVPDCYYRFWGDELLGTLSTSPEEFAQMVLGDLGGVLIPKPGISTHHRDILKGIQECWLGVKMEHFKRCFNAGKPGVIVLAIGPLRAKVILYLLLNRLVNILVIDRSLARTLIRLMDDSNRVRSLLP